MRDLRLTMAQCRLFDRIKFRQNPNNKMRHKKHFLFTKCYSDYYLKGSPCETAFEMKDADYNPSDCLIAGTRAKAAAVAAL